MEKDLFKNRSREECLKLFNENYNLAPYTVRRYFAEEIDKNIDLLEDMKQEGYLALWKACISYDDSKNCLFSTYAIYTIISKVRYFLNYYSNYYDKKKFNDSLEYLDRKININGNLVDFSNTLSCRFDIEETIADSMYIDDTLNVLKKKFTDKNIDIFARYINGEKLTDIGKCYGISKQRIFTIIEEIKNYVRYNERLVF